MINKQWLTGDEVEAEFGFSGRYLQRLRSERRLAFTKINGRTIRYRRSDVEQLLEDNRVEAQR